LHGSAEGASAPSVRFADLRNDHARQRVLWRETVVQAVQELLEAGLSQRQAITQTVSRPEYCQASPTRARTWLRHYQEHGLDGLVDQKCGRVGRRPIAADVPAHVLDAAAAAAVEHGTLGRDGRQNMARAFRNTIMSHPDLPAEARARIHGDHASKSYVPPSVRDALRVSPIAREMTRGPKAVRLATPYQPCTYERVPPGRIVTADDMTANVYCWMEAPTQTGFVLGRPQILAFLDVGSLRWQVARVILRRSGAYTRDDVWGTVGDLMDTFGVYPEWLFEGGNLWRSNRVLGERTGLREEDRFGGLRSLGCRLRHSRVPRSKPIEQAFNELQYESDRCPGYAGRDEREQSPEGLQQAIAACKRGQMHPRGCFPHVAQYASHVEDSMAALNAERNDGKILRGQSPDEAWEAAQPQMAALPARSKWLFRSNVSRVDVRRDGRVRVDLRSGKYRESYLYANPDLLQPIAGLAVLVYWNDRNPDADACILTAGANPHFLGTARAVPLVDRLDASEDEMHDVAARNKAAIAAARTEIVRLRPHFQRPQIARSAGGKRTKDGSRMAEVSRAFSRAEAQAEERQQHEYVVRTAVSRQRVGADDLDAALHCSREEFDRATTPAGDISPEDFAAAFGGENE